jgi:hypothetical protein
MKARLTGEMGDIVNYLSDTESVIKQKGTLVNTPSSLDIKQIINSNFENEDYPYNGAYF